MRMQSRAAAPAAGAPSVGLGAALSANTQVMADYYRDGKADRTEGKLYEVTPGQLNDFAGTKASIRMYSAGAASGKPVESEIIPPYTKFILNSVHESHAERSQVIETFGDFYIFMFGERPPTYTFQGVLINSKNANWVSDFMYYYENYLRGTRCLEAQAKLVLTYGGRQIEGYMLNISHATDANSENAVSVTFSVIVTARNYLGFSDDFGVTLNSSGEYDTDTKLATLAKSAKAAAEAGAGMSEQATSKAYETAKKVMSGGASPQESKSYSGTNILDKVKGLFG